MRKIGKSVLSKHSANFKSKIIPTKSGFEGYPEIVVTKHPLMDWNTYKRIAERFGFSTFSTQDMKYRGTLNDISIFHTGCYGHRHWIAVKNGRIYGLTVGHAGWIVEKPQWEKAGFKTKTIYLVAKPYPIEYLQILRNSK